MSSSPPSPSLPLTTTTAAASSPIATGPLALPSAPLDLISGASTGLLPPPVTTMPPSSSTLPAQYSPEAMAGVLNDLVVAVQGIRLYLASPYGPPPPLPPPVPSGPPTPPWYSVPAALASARGATRVCRARPSPMAGLARAGCAGPHAITATQRRPESGHSRRAPDPAGAVSTVALSDFGLALWDIATAGLHGGRGPVGAHTAVRGAVIRSPHRRVGGHWRDDPDATPVRPD
nr:formin-like protein 20 [Aegilops tauschii subsp. strangulata]